MSEQSKKDQEMFVALARVALADVRRVLVQPSAVSEELAELLMSKAIGNAYFLGAQEGQRLFSEELQALASDPEAFTEALKRAEKETHVTKH